MAAANTSTFAVLLAAAVGFLASFLWYKAFGTPWRLALGRAEPMKTTPQTYVTAAVALLVMAYVLASLIGEAGRVTIESGVVIGAMAWLGFVATSIAVNDSFAGSPVTVTLIDAGHWLVVLSLMGATIGLLGA
ncbi:DUF1761 domain-containing protein [Lutibaculum baratangense]|uniref:Integral membrane protein n=1 Tax=Lutibaculum baratangense AMV1 TaxID=631454 RepID=V4T7G3_9HYPH|nr:DUF1761 domain-containing protein [Lutibaculum baratangense]ESR22563.1 hypothetical protein N177_3699 [Lutibaculum baratangense AMV1]